MKKELIVIGGGPGGYTAALRASQLGAEVTLIEKNDLGGTCLNYGCIPTKSLLESSHTWYKSTTMFPGNVNGEMPWESIFSRKNAAVLQLRKGVEGLLHSGKIKIIYGVASLIGDKKVLVQGKENHELEADAIIIATGSRPVLPKIEGIQTEGVCTSDELLSMKMLPEKIAIIGGGVIGIEFATIFAELGLGVHVIEAADRILPNMDKDISLSLQKHLEKMGVHFSLNNKVQKVADSSINNVTLTLSEGSPIHAGLVLVAVGREAVVDNLKHDQVGIIQEGRKIKVDSFQQTNINGIYAIGDCASPIMLAHVAMAEGKIAAEHALGYAPELINYDFVPQCIYSHPEAAMVGLTSNEAKRRGFAFNEGIFSLRASGRAVIEGESTGFIKVVSDKKYGQILGIHLLCPNATEIISHATLALSLESTIDEIKNLIYPHPSIVEGIQEAVLS
jgi:dihydrolipoamide dehydrogenase